MGASADQVRTRRSRGFERASGLLADPIRKAGEGRGFAVAKVLTHWPEIAGTELAAMARPVRVSYGRDGFGATLVLLTTGAAAPLVQMRAPEIRDRVNACYGYAAIAHVKVTQTAPTGFAEGQAKFTYGPKAPAASKPARPEVAAEAHQVASGVGDPQLKAALERLALNVLSKS